MIYGDATGFVAYFEARATDICGAWDDAAIEAALLVASEWIDGVYGPSFVGHKTAGFTQEREWPRINAIVKGTGYWGEYYTFPDSEIPDRVENAAYEAAFRHLTKPGCLQVDYTPGKYKSVKIDGSISVEYSSLISSSDIQIQIARIDTLLWPLLDTYGIGSGSTFSGGSSRV
jgi:hypothetical protein